MLKPISTTPASTDTPKAKLALCIDTPDIIRYHVGMSLLPISDEFYDVPSRLIDRAICETDENTLQLLPYIVVQDHLGQGVFHYSRGKAGAEDRLKANTSIGLGGHVDIGLNEYSEDTLYELLQLEAARELKEELGITVDGMLNFTHLIVDRTNAVGRVHLGLLAVYTLPQDTAINLEEHQIVDGKFLPWHRFTEPALYNQLENWSKLAITHFANFD